MTASATALIHRIKRLTKERDKARSLRQFYDERIAEADKFYGRLVFTNAVTADFAISLVTVD